MRGRAPAGWWAAALAGLLAVPASARGEGLSLYLEPGLTLSTQDTRDQVGNTTHQEARTLAQLYRIGFDRALGPELSLAAGALLEEKDARVEDGAGLVTTTDATRRGLYGRLNLAMPVLSGGLSYDLSDATSSRSPRLVNESAAAYLGWRPLDLPELTLRLGRTHSYDTARAFEDTTTTSALLTARLRARALELKYVLQWARPDDAITGTESSSISQAAQATWNTRLFDDRTVAYASLLLHNQVIRTVVAGAGTITEQQHPIAGLSLVEQFPAEPALDTLAPNPALVDGDLAAGAAIDIGYGLSLAGDQNRRDLGVQLGDLLTRVNRIQVWVDRKLPPEVAAAWTWTAWQSDDNRTWSPIPITGPVAFGAFQNRFEIPIAETRARYLKVVTQPLLAGVTGDPALASVLVTELQVFLATAASAVPREQATSGAQLIASATTLVWRAAHLSWDLMTTMERRLSPSATIWSVLNGLSGSQPLAAHLQLSERLSRLDGDYGVGHTGQTDWSAGLLWTPLPTFTGTLVYSGQYVDALPTLDPNTGHYVVGPGNFTTTVASLARADLYRGVSAQLNASLGVINAPDGKNTWNGTLNLTGSLTPNPWLSFTFGALSGRTAVYTPEAPPVTTDSLRVDASATFRPTSTISAAGSVSRILAGPVPTTTGNVQVNFTPFHGDLQLSAAYSKTFDTASRTTLELFTPGIRWTVRQGVLLTATYSLLDNSAPVSETHSRTFSAVLSISI